MIIVFNQFKHLFILLLVNNICNVESLMQSYFYSVQGPFPLHKGQGEYRYLLLKPIYKKI